MHLYLLEIFYGGLFINILNKRFQDLKQLNQRMYEKTPSIVRITFYRDY